MRSKLAVCQWFHYEDYAAVDRAISLMLDLGVTHLRTGISWADYHRPGGRAWYDWQMKQLADFDVLLSIWHTPPSIAEGERCAGPPRRLRDYAEFCAMMIHQYGDYFSHLELWNEPNNRYKWDFENFDPQWKKFGEMIRLAARAAKRRGKPTVLGGMIPVDHHWLELMRSHGALEDIDIVAIHGFPEMWWEGAPNWDWHAHWKGWDEKIAYISQYVEGRPVWITETGLATWDMKELTPGRHDLQTQMLEKAAAAPAERVYWYSLIDLEPSRDAIEGFHVDENEYHLGLATFDGVKKPAYEHFKQLLTSSDRQ
jgi:CDP-paratose 2-epimerase